MNAQGPLSRARLLPTVLGSIVLVVAMVMLIAGARLASLGASFHLLFSGIGLAAIGILLLMAQRSAISLFAMFLVVNTIWALWDVGLDGEHLLSRLAVWFVFGALLLLPWMRRGLKPLQGTLSTAWLVIALVLATVSIEPVRQVKALAPVYKDWASSLIPTLQVVEN